MASVYFVRNESEKNSFEIPQFNPGLRRVVELSAETIVSRIITTAG